MSNYSKRLASFPATYIHLIEHFGRSTAPFTLKLTGRNTAYAKRAEWDRFVQALLKEASVLKSEGDTAAAHHTHAMWKIAKGRQLKVSPPLTDKTKGDDTLYTFTWIDRDSDAFIRQMDEQLRELAPSPQQFSPEESIVESGELSSLDPLTNFMNKD